MTDKNVDIPLLGYSDRLSARPGETIEFKVSCTLEGPVEARLMRSICADPNPASPGIVEEAADAWFAPHSFPARYQPFYPGSYAVTEHEVAPQRTIRLQASVFPMLAKPAPQTILSIGALSLCLDETGAAAVRFGDTTAGSGARLKLRNWYRLEAIYDAGALTIRQTALGSLGAHTEVSCPSAAPAGDLGGIISIAARFSDGVLCEHFNGKIEAPAVWSEADPIAAWDFSREIPTTIVRDTGPHGLDARLVNFPARAMTGSTWDGAEMCWRHAPDQYAAIHFHEDDVYDFGWQTDFAFTLPTDMPSGVYVMRLMSGGTEDAMPFYVCAPKGKPAAKLCVLIPTFTYTVYGNHARPDYAPHWAERIAAWNAYPHNPAVHQRYGLSTYNFHPDGSGICHASHLRPLFNLRPGYLTFGTGEGSGLRHFQADSHLISWLHAQGIEHDVITDRELHNEGAEAIADYGAVMTTSHPEYHTAQTLDALQSYRDTGGNLIYLGGNGFYWRVAVHSENDGLIEIRRAEDGLRAWAAEPGEYYNAFDGAYGGLWRRSGRPPQMLAGVGFTAQGQFNGSHYRRKCFDPDYDWIFEGVEGDIIGDFGLSGGGAAGYELDRYDQRLGSPENAVILASSEGHGDDFILVPEEQLTHITNWAGEPVRDLLRADMIYFDLPEGGSVFSVGSITFCGSLLENGCDNNVSHILRNIVRQMAT
jgi:N,N-dimethylformamidase